MKTQYAADKPSDCQYCYRKLCEQLRMLSDEDLEKISTFINWIT